MKIVKGNIDLRFLHLKEIPDSIAIDECTGYYAVNDNRLTSLKNAPLKVESFDCSKNNLTSLVGGPKIVTGIYRCFNNKLTSLDGIAKIIINPTRFSNSFFCGYNKITSLVGYGFESTVFYDFNIEHNNITSLNGSPPIVEATYNCSGNLITSFVGSPTEIRRYFVAEDLSKLKSLEGFPERVRGSVYLSMKDMLRVFPDFTKYDKDLMENEIRQICEIGDDLYID